ncbi:hypothetical protein CFIO01_02209 [Colletotrichum fioriniae PJ7]|uniref:Uncharacterized protein n=1 Tax=Colletotrichum fioriniae PJ7 TaxID=1445577 RepID=A0A010RWQ2_9PEZI|nr:hypothetical protein CFIO01_02209 [Colletotrichum fioriniae PJ7]
MVLRNTQQTAWVKWQCNSSRQRGAQALRTLGMQRQWTAVAAAGHVSSVHPQVLAGRCTLLYLPQNDPAYEGQLLISLARRAVPSCESLPAASSQLSPEPPSRPELRQSFPVLHFCFIPPSHGTSASHHPGFFVGLLSSINTKPQDGLSRLLVPHGFCLTRPTASFCLILLACLATKRTTSPDCFAVRPTAAAHRGQSTTSRPLALCLLQIVQSSIAEDAYARHQPPAPPPPPPRPDRSEDDEDHLRPASGSPASLLPLRSAKLYENTTLRRGFEKSRLASTVSASALQKNGHERPATASPSSKELPDLSKLAAVVQQSRKHFLSTDGIPTPQLVTAVLKTCQGAANAIQPYLSRSENRPASTLTASTASNLLSLDSNSTAAKSGSASIPSVSVKDTVDTISESAYEIIAHPTVSIGPQVLDLYVNIQARLGRPETLPHVFELYASKPKPKAVEGAVSYVQQNPNRADKAIEASVAETALGAAIDAKNLDAAIGIVEACYATQAFYRQKLLRKALLPVSAVAAAPFGVYTLASNLSAFQNTMEPVTATKFAFAAILAYLGFTATIGMVAKTTVNDHMRRVTWAPGIPLHQRWLREEERAGMDDIACAWGYREKWRHGEEGGIEWDSLKEYLGLKGMMLDRVELMEGMS